MQNIADHLFKYLEKVIPSFSKITKSGQILFTCPKIQNHKFKSKNPTATFLPNSEKITCLICGFKGTAYDCIRVIEEDKKNYSDAEITNYLIGDLELDMYKELEAYEKYGWSLVPLLQNSKNPFEQNWRETENKDKIKWIKWLNNGLNLGANCELSKMFVIDVDCKKEVPEETKQLRTTIITLCQQANTLTQKTPSGGAHYLFQWDEDLKKQLVNAAGTQIDTRTVGQIVVAPSKIDTKSYEWVNLGSEIKVIPAELKTQLLQLQSVEKSRTEDALNEEIDLLPYEGEKPKLVKNNLEGCCNDSFVKFGGVLSKIGIPAEKRNTILYWLNKNWLEQPMEVKDVQAMLSSLSGYEINSEENHEKAIYEYLKLIQSDISARDLMDGLKLPRSIVDKYLSKFVKEGKAIRMGRGRYQYKEKIEWLDNTPLIINECRYKIPLFNNIAIFQDADCLILGGKTNEGKTTIALNMLQNMIAQGVKPYYVYNEAGCFDIETEILTDNGWKTNKTISLTDKALSLNPIADFATYKPISNIFEYDYNGEVLTYDSKVLKFKLTPNHKIYYKSAFEDFYELDEFQEINKGKYYKFKTNFNIRNKHCRYEMIKMGNKKINRKVLIKFLGWFISEGCLLGLTTNKKTGYGVQITQRKKKYQKEIELILKKLDVNFHFYNNETYIFYDKDFWTWLRRQCYRKDLEKQRRSYIKLIPSFIKQALPIEIDMFLTEYTKGDGSFLKSGKNIRRDIFTGQKHLADELQILMLKSGKSARIKVTKTPQGFDFYIVRENFESEVDMKIDRVKKEIYNGKIWCIETKPYHLIFVRRNGHCFWTGNSRFQKTAQMLGINGKFYHCQHSNPLAIELESNAVSILDWLCLENKAETDTVLKHINDELQRKRGILIIFTQLKKDYEWFAPNLIDHFPTFAARYIQDNETHTEGHFQCDKIKEPRGNYTQFSLSCVYDHDTRVFKLKDLI
jgi:hypothetical protein